MRGLRSAVPGRNGGMAARYFGTAQCAGAYGHWADLGVCFLLWGEPGLRLGGVVLAGWATLLQSSPLSAFGWGETGSAGVRLWPSAGGSEALVICRSRVLGGFRVLDRAGVGFWGLRGSEALVIGGSEALGTGRVQGVLGGFGVLDQPVRGSGDLPGCGDGRETRGVPRGARVRTRLVVGARVGASRG
jgi:hypothetical protein